MTLIPQSVTRTIGRQILLTKKNSPHIFFVGGVIGVVTSTVLACRATLKLEKTLDEISEDLETVKTINKDSKEGNGEYAEKEYTKDLAYTYGTSVYKITRLYAPSLALGVVSIAALTGSHVQLTRRNAALTATLAAVSKAYEDYRVRVQNVVGKERELDIYRAVREEEVEGENNKKKLVKIVNPFGTSPYARLFDEYSNEWQKDAEFNRIFLQCQQNYANHKLRARGHVFLNEVYDSLGLERTRAGAVVGWVNNGEGDDYIDFGIFEAYNERFVMGLERSLILDFNVDGVVYDKI